jgi:hypothetical protein
MHMLATSIVSTFRALAATIGGVCLATALVWAQPALSRIDGTVTDTSGGALPGVAVTLTMADGATVTAFTNQVGRFAFAEVPGARATLTYELGGFETVTDEVALRAGGAITVGRALPLHGIKESVSVVGTAPPEPPPPPIRMPPPVAADVPEHEAAAVCGPTMKDSSQVSVGEIIGHRFDEERELYAKGDELLLAGWSAGALRIGTNLVVRRRFAVTSKTSSGARISEAVHSAGLIQVVDVQQGSPIAVVVYACEELRKGDYLDVFEPESVRPVEPSGTPDYARAARVLFADEGQMVGTPRRLMVIERGRDQGVLPGQRMTLFRQGRKGRNVITIGSAVVKYATRDSATILIEAATDIIEPGDSAAPHWVMHPFTEFTARIGR